MHKKSKRPRYLFLYALVVLACVGLAMAVSYKRARRAEIERARPKASEPAAVEPAKKISMEGLETTIGTQKMSLRVDAAVELEDPLAPSKTLLLSARAERPPAQIIPSDPKVFVEEARKNIDAAPETNASPVLEARGEKIVTDE